MTDSPAKPRLLIVDDETEVRGVLHDLLCGAYECAEASSAEEALAQLRESDFELVISDITMSGMSGLEMIPHVKTVSPDTVIVMISGMQTIESAINALRLGAFDYLMKPFDLRQAEAAVSRAWNITNWSSRRSVMKPVWKNWSSNAPPNWIKRWIRWRMLIAPRCKR